ncbi:MAG: hypothetical protein GF344_03440 [Chitinivibrionales bacterium]|nr:hypothetical protein [Chitinivibrionales bacterium]MBD3356125.1 hypothetical protein [Chitinivibrionales bacterium]
MKRLIQLTLGIAVFSNVVFSQVDTAYPYSPDQNYYDLIAYRLSPDLEAQFDPSDEKISEFWHLWDSTAHIERDYIELNAEYNGNTLGNEGSTEGFSGEHDARMWVRAAWSPNGLYLYLKVNDDYFAQDAFTRCVTKDDGTEVCDDEITRTWYNDAVDLYFDPHPTQVLYNDEERYFDRPGRYSTTKDMLQIQYQFGEMDVVPETFSYNKMVYNEVLSTYEFKSERDFTFERAELEADGLIAEILSAQEEEGLSSTEQVMEWFFPWEQVGSGGGVYSPNEGTQFAFACGYNDSDPGTDGYDLLRWIRAGDPFKRTQLSKESSEHDPVEAWGDIVLGRSVPVIRPLKRNAGRSLPISHVEYFTPAGRLVASIQTNNKDALPENVKINVPANTILLKRLISPSGESIVGKPFVYTGHRR